MLMLKKYGSYSTVNLLVIIMTSTSKLMSLYLLMCFRPLEIHAWMHINLTHYTIILPPAYPGMLYLFTLLKHIKIDLANRH